MDDDELPEDSDMEEECLSDDEDDAAIRTSVSRKRAGDVGPQKTKIVIRDAAFRTWYALVYYLYTDVIVFAPLASSFINKSDAVDAATGSGRSKQADENQILKGIKGRKQWLETWMTERAEGSLQEPIPCSAKAIYRLADVGVERGG